MATTATVQGPMRRAIEAINRIKPQAVRSGVQFRYHTTLPNGGIYNGHSGVYSTACDLVTSYGLWLCPNSNPAHPEFGDADGNRGWAAWE